MWPITIRPIKPSKARIETDEGVQLRMKEYSENMKSYHKMLAPETFHTNHTIQHPEVKCRREISIKYLTLCIVPGSPSKCCGGLREVSSIAIFPQLGASAPLNTKSEINTLTALIQWWQPHYTITKTSLEGEKSKHYCYPKIKKHFIVLGQSNHSTKQQSSVDLLSMEKFSWK